MKIRYLGPADRLIVGNRRIPRGTTAEITDAEYAALGAKQSRVEVIAPPKPPAARRTTTRRTRKKKESPDARTV